jgi:hypothetical protein
MEMEMEYLMEMKLGWKDNNKVHHHQDSLDLLYQRVDNL